MKEINIYLTGKYDYSFKFSSWAYYLNYKDAVIKGVGSKYENGSMTRALLHALYEAIQRVKEPCIIRVYSKYPLGFNRSKKSNEKDLILNIVSSIIKAGHIIEYNVDKILNQVNIWEQLYGTPINYNKHSISNKDEDDIVKDKTRVIMNSYDYKSLYEDDDLYSGGWVPGSGGY